MKDKTDKEILEAFAHSDERRQNEAVRYMYLHYFPSILSFVQRNNGLEEDAADIFQDALLVFYQKSREKDFSLNCTIKTYVYSICKNTWYYRLRGRKKEVRMEFDLETVPLEENTLDILIEKDYKQIIADLMNQLGEKCRDILTHVYFDKMRMDEIAHRVDMSSAQVVRNQKARCMKKLRKMVESSDELRKILS